jgi:predicted nuclease of restriction endonuclease-like RecB superfamily
VLTAELVGVRRRGSELRLTATDGARRARIEALAALLTAAARAQLGRPRDEVEEALRLAAAEALAGSGSERRLVDAVGKLVHDGLRFEEPVTEASVALRRETFRRAAAARRAAPSAPFDRAAVLEDVARAQGNGTTAAAVEAGLYADRPSAQRLLAVEATAPALLAAGFELCEAQAVLLRATKVAATVRATDAAIYRRLFRRLKFLRLLPVITARQNDHRIDGYRIEIDGPLSLFQGGGRYGLQLALALPAIAACDAWSIEADVRWGRERRALGFRLAGEAASGQSPSGAAANRQPTNRKAATGQAAIEEVAAREAAAGGDARAASAPPELAAFVAAFERLQTGWRIDREPAILDLPGAGLCVPDLAFVRDGVCVYFELLGFWSREAVFRRVDLVRAGLPQRILFAVSKSLRVGEAVLEGAPTAALYVFGRVIAAREILRRLEELAA